MNPNARHLAILKQEGKSRINEILNKSVCPEENRWDVLSLSQDKNAINLLEKNPEKIDWYWLCLCLKKNTLPLLEKFPEKINWTSLRYNEFSIPLLEKYPEKIIWWRLSYSSAGMRLLEKNQEKIDWNTLSRNPSIFKNVINYKYLTERMNLIKEELMMKCMHPKRLSRWIEMGGDIDDF